MTFTLYYTIIVTTIVVIKAFGKRVLIKTIIHSQENKNDCSSKVMLLVKSTIVYFDFLVFGVIKNHKTINGWIVRLNVHKTIRFNGKCYNNNFKTNTSRQCRNNSGWGGGEEGLRIPPKRIRSTLFIKMQNSILRLKDVLLPRNDV